MFVSVNQVPEQVKKRFAAAAAMLSEQTKPASPLDRLNKHADDFWAAQNVAAEKGSTEDADMVHQTGDTQADEAKNTGPPNRVAGDEARENSAFD